MKILIRSTYDAFATHGCWLSEESVLAYIKGVEKAEEHEPGDMTLEEAHEQIDGMYFEQVEAGEAKWSCSPRSSSTWYLLPSTGVHEIDLT